jgi:glycosyltransferase involved in cell wall biosynthesis
MRLSVAMCTYDGAAFLGEQLESVAVQTRAPDELVVCDDRSRDASVEIVREFAARARRSPSASRSTSETSARSKTSSARSPCATAT